MKLLILQENLSKGLNTVLRSVATRATLPILGNILLSTERGRLKLSATNLETGINLWLPVKIEKEGSLTIPAKILTEFVNSLPPGKVEVEDRENTLFLSSDSFKANFAGTPPNEFPQTPPFNEKPVLVFKKEELVGVLSQVAFAAAQTEGRPVLTGVLIKKSGKRISLIATDGYRLSVKSINIAKNKLEKDLLIPAKTLIEVSKIAQEQEKSKEREDEEIQLLLNKEKSQVVFKFNNVEYSSKLLEGEFPDFEKIIPSQISTTAAIDKEELLKATRVASIFAREQANIVQLKINPAKGGVTVSAETPQVGANESVVQAKVTGEKLEVAFNCRFLLEFLNTAPEGELVFEGSGSLSPGVFKVKGDDSYLHIIMPVRVQS